MSATDLFEAAAAAVANVAATHPQEKGSDTTAAAASSQISAAASPSTPATAGNTTDASNVASDATNTNVNTGSAANRATNAVPAAPTKAAATATGADGARDSTAATAAATATATAARGAGCDMMGDALLEIALPTLDELASQLNELRESQEEFLAVIQRSAGEFISGGPRSTIAPIARTMTRIPEYQAKIQHMNAQMASLSRRARAVKARATELELRKRKERGDAHFQAPQQPRRPAQQQQQQHAPTRPNESRRPQGTTPPSASPSSTGSQSSSVPLYQRSLFSGEKIDQSLGTLLSSLGATSRAAGGVGGGVGASLPISQAMATPPGVREPDLGAPLSQSASSTPSSSTASRGVSPTSAAAVPSPLNTHTEPKSVRLSAGNNSTRSPIPAVEPGQLPEAIEPVSVARKSKRAKKPKSKGSGARSPAADTDFDDSASVGSDRSQEGKRPLRKTKKKTRKQRPPVSVEIDDAPSSPAAESPRALR